MQRPNVNFDVKIATAAIWAFAAIVIAGIWSLPLSNFSKNVKWIAGPPGPPGPVGARGDPGVPEVTKRDLELVNAKLEVHNGQMHSLVEQVIEIQQLDVIKSGLHELERKSKVDPVPPPGYYYGAEGRPVSHPEHDK